MKDVEAQGTVYVVQTEKGQDGMGVSRCVPYKRLMCRPRCRGLEDARLVSKKVDGGRIHSSRQGSGRGW
jgi:hypothetical protein